MVNITNLGVQIYSNANVRNSISDLGNDSLVERRQMLDFSKTTPSYETKILFNEGFSFIGFLQWNLLQCLFILMYKNLNCQSIGGNTSISSTYTDYNQGHSDTLGMYAKSPNNSSFKFCGLESFYGALGTQLDGIEKHGASGNIKISLDNTFEMDEYGRLITDDYYDTGISSLSLGYIDSVLGDENAPFLPTGNAGSSSTYYCDRAQILNETATDYCFHVGKSYDEQESGGIFRIFSQPIDTRGMGTRLMFL